MLFNKEVKEKFLNILNSESLEYLYRSKLESAHNNEKILNKDLYEFTRSEILDTIKGIKSPSLNAVRTTVSAYRKYISWAAHNGYINSSIIPIETVSTEEMEELIYRDKKSLITEEELRRFESNGMLVNYVDQALYRGIFEGIYGKKMIELANLRISDIDEDTNTVDIKYGEHPRKIKVSQRLIDLLYKANNEKTYILSNGNANSKAKEKKIVDNEYIFRGINNGRLEDPMAAVRYSFFYTRIRYLKELTNLSFLTPKNISRSGMLYKAYELYKQSGKLGTEEYMEIIKTFPVGKTGLNGEYYNLSGIKEVVNMANLEEYYLQSEKCE